MWASDFQSLKTPQSFALAEYGSEIQPGLPSRCFLEVFFPGSPKHPGKPLHSPSRPSEGLSEVVHHLLEGFFVWFQENPRNIVLLFFFWGVFVFFCFPFAKSRGFEAIPGLAGSFAALLLPEGGGREAFFSLCRGVFARVF